MPDRSRDRDVDSGPRALRTERIASLDEAHAEWTSLAAPTRNIFATWEWNSIWWKHFGDSRPLLVHRCRSDDGALVAILPLYLWRKRPFRVVRFIGHHDSDQLGPIYLPEYRREVGDAITRLLPQLGTDVFVAERLPSEERWADLLPARGLHVDASPVVRFASGDWQDFLRSKSRNFRDQARRRERRLAETYEVRFRLAEDPERLEGDLDALFGLHSARWAGGRTTFGSHEAFHREFAACALERGWLRLWFLEVDGEPRAACYGLRFGDVESFYQSGRDPSWDRYSVGFIILLHSIRAALADGMTEYRLLRGHEPYKYRFANEDHSVETIAVARTRLSRFAVESLVTARRSGAYRTLTALRGRLASARLADRSHGARGASSSS